MLETQLLLILVTLPVRHNFGILKFTSSMMRACNTSPQTLLQRLSGGDWCDYGGAIEILYNITFLQDNIVPVFGG